MTVSMKMIHLNETSRDEGGPTNCSTSTVLEITVVHKITYNNPLSSTIQNQIPDRDMAGSICLSKNHDAAKNFPLGAGQRTIPNCQYEWFCN